MGTNRGTLQMLILISLFLVSQSDISAQRVDDCKAVFTQLIFNFQKISVSSDGGTNKITNDVIDSCFGTTDDTRPFMLTETNKMFAEAGFEAKKTKNVKKLTPKQFEQLTETLLRKHVIVRLSEGESKVAMLDLLNFEKTPLLLTLAEARQYNAENLVTEVYNPIQKSEKKFKGKEFCFQGIIQQAKEEAKATGFRVTDNQGEYNSLFRFAGVDTDECQVNATFKTCGKFKGLTTYPSVGGVLNTVPVFDATLIRCGDVAYQAKR
jgi:hypothetical protein